MFRRRNSGGKPIVTDQGDFATPSALDSVDLPIGARTIISRGGFPPGSR
jgi:hypothetical protein